MCPDGEAIAVTVDPAADRRGDEVGVGGEEIDDLRTRGEAIGVGVRKGEIRQLHRPVGELEPQAIPALRPPTFGDPTPLEHEMPAAALAQPVAQRQPGLAAADDQRLYALNRHDQRIASHDYPLVQSFWLG